MKVDNVFIPENLHYIKEHELASIAKRGLVKIGIMDRSPKKRYTR